MDSLDVNKFYGKAQNLQLANLTIGTYCEFIYSGGRVVTVLYLFMTSNLKRGPSLDLFESSDLKRLVVASHPPSFLNHH